MGCEATNGPSQFMEKQIIMLVQQITQVCSHMDKFNNRQFCVNRPPICVYGGFPLLHLKLVSGFNFIEVEGGRR